jgi:DNA-directed RNA polymerase specialized sigma24 family protein
MDVSRRAAAAPADPLQIERETRWLAQVAAGGPAGDAAMRELFRVYQRRFQKSLRWRGLSEESALDATQQVWLDVTKKAGAFRPGATPSCWLWGFVDIALADALRKRSRWGRTVSANDEAFADDVETSMADLTAPSPETLRALDAVRRCVRDAFAAFKRRHVDEAWLLYLREVEDWTLEQVAEFRRSTKHAAEEFLSKARRKFRPLVQPCLALRPD